MNWNVKNVVERFVWTVILTFAGVLAALPATNFSSLGDALEPAIVAALIAGFGSIGKNLTAEGIVVESVKRSGAA